MNYSVKMRAEENGLHISGAERIVGKNEVEEAVSSLMARIRSHPNGNPDSVVIKINQIKRGIVEIPALEVTEPTIRSVEEAKVELGAELERMGLPSERILDLLYSLKDMRGAVLLDAATLERLEPDQERGIRASNMDYAGNTGGGKNHFREALCLASKVANCPFIIGELCISDDKDYTTGYFASQERGYVRIANIKTKGDLIGGRIFLFQGMRENIQECIDYLENQPVFVRERPD